MHFKRNGQPSGILTCCKTLAVIALCFTALINFVTSITFSISIYRYSRVLQLWPLNYYHLTAHLVSVGFWNLHISMAVIESKFKILPFFKFSTIYVIPISLNNVPWLSHTIQCTCNTMRLFLKKAYLIQKVHKKILQMYFSGKSLHKFIRVFDEILAISIVNLTTEYSYQRFCWKCLQMRATFFWISQFPSFLVCGQPGNIHSIFTFFKTY